MFNLSETNALTGFRVQHECTQALTISQQVPEEKREPLRQVQIWVPPPPRLVVALITPCIVAKVINGDTMTTSFVIIDSTLAILLYDPRLRALYNL